MQLNAEHATVLPPEALVAPAQVKVPVGVMNLPARPQVFVGRCDALGALDSASAHTGLMAVQVVHGLGGIGKSTLAARWADRQAGTYYPIWWITADSVAALDAGLVALAAALQPALAGVLASEVLRERAVQWLASHDGWLLILDNVNDPDHITDLVGRLPRGRIVITSRRANGWPDQVSAMCLTVLDEDEAVDLLTATLARAQISAAREDLVAVCTQLGCLPLAVQQAGAYLSQTGITARDYLDLLARYPAVMYGEGDEGRAGWQTIARLWRVTLDRLTDDPLVGQALRVLAFFAPEVIPRRLLLPLGEAPAVARAIGRLAAYNMITVDSAAGTLTVHRLVQALARTSDEHDPHRLSADINAAHAIATATLTEALPQDHAHPANWPEYRTLLPHLDALVACTHPNADNVGTACLLIRAGLFLQTQGNLARATEYLYRAHTSNHRLLGEEHPDTVTSMSHLAGVYQAAGDLHSAIPLFERALTDRRRFLGDEHPDTLTAMNNLARAYNSAGDLDRAIPLYEQTLTDRRRVLGDDHRHTLTSANNLAYAYRAGGEQARAILLYEQVLDDRRRLLGEDHPGSLTSMNNLAYAYQARGDLNRAIPLYEQTLTDRRRVLGDDHPQTLTSVSNLARAYEAAGDHGRAIPLQEQALTARHRVLGDDHPDTLNSMNNLAHAYQTAGDVNRAIPLYEQTLTDRRRVLGDDHPQTLNSMNNLAHAYQTAGDLIRAIPLYEQTLTDRRRVLGDDHPDTKAVQKDLDALLRDQRE
ncbi:tetratricopeptide repeat protein [Nucisporomicrobium flavum]|uniref:tetratricopeptide repeat protein n=1 Tax=Nucisporomicrobium flavum TaxID=2785915 RepID=UPI0018F63817|nr:tetratricopeptide repeat protein [Nucisporomicrobium flavum]